MVGDQDVTTTTLSAGAGKGGRSRSVSVTRDRVLTAADVRTIPRGWALLLATGSPAGLLQLEPWYTGPRRQEIVAAEHAAQRRTTETPQQATGDPWAVAR